MPGAGVRAPAAMLRKMRSLDVTVIEQRDPPRIFYVFPKNERTCAFVDEVHRAEQSYLSLFSTIDESIKRSPAATLSPAEERENVVQEWRADYFEKAEGASLLGQETLTLIPTVWSDRPMPAGGVRAPDSMLKKMRALDMEVIEQRNPRRIAYVFPRNEKTRAFVDDVQNAGRSYLKLFSTVRGTPEEATSETFSPTIERPRNSAKRAESDPADIASSRDASARAMEMQISIALSGCDVTPLADPLEERLRSSWMIWTENGERPMQLGALDAFVVAAMKASPEKRIAFCVPRVEPGISVGPALNLGLTALIEALHLGNRYGSVPFPLRGARR